MPRSSLPCEAAFELHSTLDVERSEAERRMLAAAGEEDEEASLEGTADALEAWWDFLDGVDPDTAR